MLYKNIHTQNELTIDRIHFIGSFSSDEAPDCDETNRSGDFWELFYVENGLITLTNLSCCSTLSNHGLFFRAPAETVSLCFHSSVPAKLFCIGFDCSCDAMDVFRQQLLSIGSSERRLLKLMLHEAQACDTGTDTAFAAGQLIQLYLQQLLILLIRNERFELTLTAANLKERRQNEEELFQTVVAYMENNLCSRLTIDRICRDNLIGRGLLQKIFSDYAGCGIIDYFSLMKINAAKQLIREKNMNFSQIAEYLGYNSIHYFSRHFKHLTGMTPSDYAAGTAHPNIF